jgi:hypothetical protein
MSIIRIGSDETIDLNYSVSEDLTELEQFLTVTQDNTNKDLTNLGIDDIFFHPLVQMRTEMNTCLILRESLRI